MIFTNPGSKYQILLEKERAKLSSTKHYTETKGGVTRYILNND